ncbi:hypothetical protein EVAR_52839_1 [Eumeta japonica]|uniref:Uncharacterized protein n=1 Tax=Eumeta variegata TaxID=151549 RepID=A0A4C1YD84_EUMVA|nr:hypothetical protein EVAR_52839_1 [Eumeta japonica]
MPSDILNRTWKVNVYSSLERFHLIAHYDIKLYFSFGGISAKSTFKPSKRGKGRAGRSRGAGGAGGHERKRQTAAAPPDVSARSMGVTSTARLLHEFPSSPNAFRLNILTSE